MAEESTVGQLLRAAREYHGWSLAEVAAHTKISTANLEALEADDWSSLPPMVYALGFLKIYARHLGLDPTPLLARSDQTPPAPPPTPTREPTPSRVAARSRADAHQHQRAPTPPPPRPRRTATPAVHGAAPRSGNWITAVVVLALAFGGIFYLLHHERPTQHLASPPTGRTQQKHARHHHAGSGSTKPPGQNGQSGNKTHPHHHHTGASSSSSSPPTGPAPTVTLDSVKELVYTVSQGPAVLELQASSSACWMEETLNGVLQGNGGGTTIAAGQTVTLTESQSVQVLLGDPQVVTMTVNGHPEGLASQGTPGGPRTITIQVSSSTKG